MSDQNKSNHPRPIPPIALPNSIPPYNQVSNIFSRLGQTNQPFPLPSQQFPIGTQGANANRVPQPRNPINRQRPMSPAPPQWPIRPGFPIVGQPNQLLMQPSFQFPPDVLNNSPQLMLLNQQRNNLAAMYLQQVAQAQNSIAAATIAAAANQNASPMIRPMINFPPSSNISSASSNSPINKDSSLSKQNSHSSLVNSPDSNTNTSSVTTPIVQTTTTTSASTSVATTLTSTTLTAIPSIPVTTTAAINTTTPLAAQNLIAAAVASTALQNPVKPPTNPVEAALAASNAVAANNIASPVFQQKLLPIPQHKRKTLPIASPPSLSPQIAAPTGFLQQRPPLINPAANPLLQTLRPVVDPHLLVPNTTSHIPPEFDNGIDDTVLLSKRKIQELVSRIDPNERLDNDVEELIMEITQKFVKDVTEFSCKIAKHRKSDLLETKDLVLGLSMKHNIQVPGFVDSIKPINKKIVTQRHQQKALLVRKAIRDKSLGIRKTVSFKDHSEGRKYNKHKNNDNNNNNSNNNNKENESNKDNEASTNNENKSNNDDSKPNNEEVTNTEKSEKS